ncbi:MAG: hypothetical protein KZQ83_15675 [gamma proteobacterium symbiont of Taylorina sp.]|nr:hypothetical protein [gamma proteobacterium symbiont of Taylorina sp.]
MSIIFNEIIKPFTLNLLSTKQMTTKLLTGQRRMGKSSIAREIGRNLSDNEKKNWSFVFIDLQSCATGIEMVARLAEEMHKHPDFKTIIDSWSKSFIQLFDKVEKISAGKFSITIRDVLNTGNWQLKGRELLEKIESNKKRTFLVFDEFPDLINKLNKNEGVTGVETLLDWLRPEIQATVPNNKISIFLSGSIGLEPVLNRLKLMDKINNLSVYRLKPWKREIAKNCFKALANYKSITFNNNAIEYLLDQLGIYIPYHIQRIWARLYEYLLEEEQQIITLEIAQHVFTQVILLSESTSMIGHYEDRLEETLGIDNYPVAIKLLDAMCEGDWFTSKELSQLKVEYPNIDLHYILEVLVHDGYLAINNNQWIFNDSLLRKWWQVRKNVRCL